MNNREFFHESVVRDIVDLLSSVKDFDEVQFLSNSSSNRSFKSITSATKDLILTFPVMVSTDIDPQNAVMIAKAHEKKCASLLHILFTAICINSSEDVYDFVRKFHTNLGSMNGTFDDYVDSLDKLGSSFDEGFKFTGTIDKTVLNTVLQELKESNYIMPDDIKESSISDYRILPGSDSPMIVHEAKRNNNNRNRHNNSNNNNNSNTVSNNINTNVNSINKQMDNLSDTINRKRDEINALTKDFIKYKSSSIKDRESMAKTKESEYKNMAGTVLNTEYKKANELMPTMMVINFIQK